MNLSAFSVELTVGTLIVNSTGYFSHWRSREGHGIAWARIAGSKGIPQYTNATMMVFMPEGTVATIYFIMRNRSQGI